MHETIEFHAVFGKEDFFDFYLTYIYIYNYNIIAILQSPCKFKVMVYIFLAFFVGVYLAKKYLWKPMGERFHPWKIIDNGFTFLYIILIFGIGLELFTKSDTTFILYVMLGSLLVDIYKLHKATKEPQSES